MKWYRQVWHVTRKDARHVRPYALVYVALIACLTAMLWPGLAPSLESAVGMASMVVYFVLGAVLVAMVVQADAPANDRAQWPVLPLSRSALAASKILTAVGLLMLPIVAGQALIFLSLGVPPMAALAHTVPSLALGSFIILCVATVASVTRTPQAIFLVAVAGTVIAAAVITPILELGGFAGHMAVSIESGGPPAPSLPGLVLLAPAFIGWMYHSRAVRAGRATLAIGFGVWLVAVILHMNQPFPTESHALEVLPSPPDSMRGVPTEAGAVVWRELSAPRATVHHLQARLDLKSIDGYQPRISVRDVVLVESNGAESAVTSPMVYHGRRFSLVASGSAGGYRVLTAGSMEGDTLVRPENDPLYFQAILDETQMARVRLGGSRIRLSAVISLWQPQEVMRLSAEDGTILKRRGVRAFASEPEPGVRRVEYGLEWPTRTVDGERLVFSVRDLAGGFVAADGSVRLSDGGGGSQWMLLPTTRFLRGMSFSESGTPDEHRSQEFVMAAWVPTYSYTVPLEIALPPP